MKLAWNSCTLIVAPSNSGKTTLTTRIVLERNSVFNENSQLCLWYYDTAESVPEALKNRADVIIKQGLPEIEDLKKYAHLKPLIVIDDGMLKLDQNTDCLRLVSVLTHHLNMAVIFLLHSIFYSKTIRMLRLNSTYIILFKNTADMSSARCLASQLMPGKGKAFMAIYMKVTSKPYSYLLIDLDKACDDQLRLRDNLFPNEKTHVYIPV